MIASSTATIKERQLPMAPEEVKKLLVVVSVFLVIFLVFFFFFWRPRYTDLRTYHQRLSEKQVEEDKLKQDAADWPDSITREELNRYSAQLSKVLEKVPEEEEVSEFLKNIQGYAIASGLSIKSLVREPSAPRSTASKAAESRYARVTYTISVDGDYFSLISFLRELEDSDRLFTVTSTKVTAEPGGQFIGAEVQFDIFYSRVGVETG